MAVAQASAKKPEKGKGRKEAKAKAQQRTDYMKVYGDKAEPFHLNDQEFRFTLLRRDLGDINIDRLVETAEWRDEGTEEALNTIPVLRGTIGLRKPHPDTPDAAITINEGHVIKCDVKWGTRWQETWRMRIQKPSLGWTDGSWSFELADDLVLLSQSRADFRYVRGKKKRRKGWYYHEIVKDIARRFRIPLGEIARGKHRIKKFTHSNISPLEAIRLATQIERKHEHRLLVIRWEFTALQRRSALTIRPLRRNNVLYQFRDQIRTAMLTEETNAKRASALIVRGVQKKKDKKRKKIRTRVVNPAAVRKFGYIQREYDAGTVDSVAEARREAKLKIARWMQPKKVIESFTHSGIALVRRGDAVQILIPEEGYRDQDSIVFVVSAIHSLSGGDYTMDLTLGLTDPVNKAREEREKAIRAQKRKNRKKKEEES